VFTMMGEYREITRLSSFCVHSNSCTTTQEQEPQWILPLCYEWERLLDPLP
jgi:hypothetical protein